jgi:serine/threonine protein kinase
MTPSLQPTDDAAQDVGDFAPGDVFSERFRVVRRLAGGGVGNVYEAVNVWTTRRVALKVLRPERADNTVLIRRFQIEAEAATRVAHPNVVAVIDMGRDLRTGVLYLVQEYLEGRDLYDAMMQRSRYAPAEAMAIMAPVMRALQAAHEKSVLHRDLKPENIFLAQGPGGEVVPKVIDFGLARMLVGSLRVTEMGVVNGTPAYMSPEQACGDADLDARTDVWSAGVIWYELLAGRQPFYSESLKALFQSILHEEPAALDQVSPEVPPALARVVHRALAKERERRFESMACFLDALEATLPSSAPAKPAPRAVRLDSEPDVAARVTPARTRTPLPPRPDLRLAVPLVGALLLAPLVWAAARRQADPAPVAAPRAAPHPAAPVAAPPSAPDAAAMATDAATDVPVATPVDAPDAEVLRDEDRGAQARGAHGRRRSRGTLSPW